MKLSTTLFVFTSVLVVLVFKLALTDAAALFNGESMIENSASEENDASLRTKKDTSAAATEDVIALPQRRHHLKFGVLGKRYAYGYLGKRNNVPQIYDDYEGWLNELRERRAGRPQYGMLG